VDISAEALELRWRTAGCTSDRHVVLLQADVRTVAAEMLHPLCDIVVSNPPTPRAEFASWNRRQDSSRRQTTDGTA
jgi:hypothetical protein